MHEKGLIEKCGKEKGRFLLVVFFFLLSGVIYSCRFQSGALDMGTPIAAEEIGVSEKAAETWMEKLNINTATAEELETLPGIGEARAADIIAYREEHGAFAQIEDMMKISGIGEKTFAEMEEQITVGE